MKINNKDIVEIVGIITVVASLVFVGMQLLLDRRVAIAEQYFNRAESVKEDRRTTLLNPVYYQRQEEIWSLGWRPPYWNKDWKIAKQVDDGDISVSSLFSRVIEYELHIIGYDNIYFQYQQGLIGEEDWQGFRAFIKRRIKADSELARVIYLKYSRSAIRPVIEQVVREIDSDN